MLAENVLESLRGVDDASSRLAELVRRELGCIARPLYVDSRIVQRDIRGVAIELCERAPRPTELSPPELRQGGGAPRREYRVLGALECIE